MSQLIPVLWQTLAAVLVWWIANTIASVASKRVMVGGDAVPDKVTDWTVAFRDLRWIELTALQHLVGMLLSILILKSPFMNKSVWPKDAHKKTIWVAGLGNLLGNMGTNAAYSLVSSGATQVIKACEPVATFFLSLALYKSSEPQLVTTLTSIVIMIVGACTFVVLDASFNVWGVLAAVCSNIAFPVRNIYLKKLSDVWESPLQKYAVISLCSTVILSPVLCIKFLLTGVFFSNAASDSITSSLSHFTYNVASIGVLQNVTPVTHAILNLSKRIFVITVNLIYFHTPLSLNMGVGLAVFGTGLLLYTMRNSMSSRAIKWTIGTLMVCVFVFHVAVPHDSSSIKTSAERVSINTPAQLPITTTLIVPTTKPPSEQDTIMMAWTFDRPMSHDILMNIQQVHRQYPTKHIHVYCGTSHCMHAIESLGMSRITTEFVVAPEIIKDTVFEEWLIRHPLYKVLAQKKFEQHLQEAIRLALLWHHGGYYFDPRLKPLSTEFSLKGGENAWVCNSHLKDDAFIPLDISYFPKQHPLINALANNFVHAYPKEGNKQGTFSFDFKKVFTSTFAQFCASSIDDCPSNITLQFKRLAVSDNINHFGTLSYDTRVPYIGLANLGDEMQGYPGLQFVPFLDYFVERDSIFKSRGVKDNITMFFNAFWGSKAAQWPPPPVINPIMVSVHIHPPMKPQWIQHIDYARSKEPIGCRDDDTLHTLREHHVKAYFSGCLTLLLKNPSLSQSRSDNIYFVDVKPDMLKLLPLNIRQKGIVINHNMQGPGKMFNILRYTETFKLIEKYAAAKLVITQRIHCALPCVAMGTPVIFINSADLPGGGGSKTVKSTRTSGLTPLFHTLDFYSKSKAEAQKWFRDFPWDNPPPNPRVDMMMRLRASFLNVIRQHQPIYDGGRKFGIIPLGLPKATNKVELIFHVLVDFPSGSNLKYGASTHDSFNWRYWGAIESIFRHHPFASVIVHSNTVKQSEFDVLTEAAYDIQVQGYRVAELLKDTPAEKVKKSHVSKQLLQVLMLYKWGGISVDTDLIVVKSLDSLAMNGFAMQGLHTNTLSSNLMRFERGNLFLDDFLTWYADNYDENTPDLLAKFWRRKEKGNEAQVFDKSAVFTLDSGRGLTGCFQSVNETLFDSKLQNGVYAVDLNLGSGKGQLPSDVKDASVCKHLLGLHCVLCNKDYLL